MSLSIEPIIAGGLCCGCGACVGVCPTKALTIDLQSSHVPVIDETKCTSCGLCMAVCPGQGYPVCEWSKKTPSEGCSMHRHRGPVRSYLLGYSADPNIRLTSASGGIATSLMLHLLDTAQVDDVAVVGMENERPVARLTHDPGVVRDAMMSKYGPVPVLATLIPELRKRPRRLAVTCTPCQLGGWFRAVKRIPALRESTMLTIGLFCGQVQSYDSIAAIAATLGIEYPGENRFVAWRYGAYPGSARFEHPGGTAAEKPLYQSYDIAIPFYSLNRCFLCPDGGNWLADMTLGDIHAGGTDKTVIVCRTHVAEKALQSAVTARTIVVEDMAPDQIETCVIHGITRSKLLPAIARIAWMKKKDRKAPEFDYGTNIFSDSEGAWRLAMQIWKYRLTLWARDGWRMRWLLRHPRRMEQTGHMLYRFPMSLPGWKSAARLRSLIRRFN